LKNIKYIFIDDSTLNSFVDFEGESLIVNNWSSRVLMRYLKYSEVKVFHERISSHTNIFFSTIDVLEDCLMTNSKVNLYHVDLKKIKSNFENITFEYCSIDGESVMNFKGLSVLNMNDREKVIMEERKFVLDIKKERRIRKQEIEKNNELKNLFKLVDPIIIMLKSNCSDSYLTYPIVDMFDLIKKTVSNKKIISEEIRMIHKIFEDAEWNDSGGFKREPDRKIIIYYLEDLFSSIIKS
jgi:hypothetical protein